MSILTRAITALGKLAGVSITREAIPKPRPKLITRQELHEDLTAEIRTLKNYKCNVSNPTSPEYRELTKEEHEQLSTKIYRLQTLRDNPNLLRVIVRAVNARQP
jgi:hypothetical protein